MFMNPPAVVLKKSVAGLVYIYIAGIVLALGIAWIVRTVLLTDQADAGLVIAIAGLGLMFDLLGVYIFAYTYSLSKVVITKSHISVTNYPSPFAPAIAEADIAEIEDVRTKRTGILSVLFGYGTIIVETAGTHPDLTLTMVPNVSKWELYLIDLHDQAAPTPQQP